MTDQQRNADIAKAVEHALNQARVVAQEWERQAGEFKGVADQERARADRYLGEIGTARLLLKDYADGGLVDAIRAALVRADTAEATLRAVRDVLSDDVAMLTLVGAVQAIIEARDTAEARADKFDRMNDDFRSEHEMMRHQASEALVGAQAANNAMYHAIKREREATERYELAMLQIRDAHNVLAQAGILSEPHEPHEGCQTQLGHRVRDLAEHARKVDATNDDMFAKQVALERQCAELTQLARALVASLHGDDNNVTPDTAAALRAVERALRNGNPPRVSSSPALLAAAEAVLAPIEGPQLALVPLAALVGLRKAIGGGG